MSNTDQAPEPTMDEILASIRRIISDEPTDNNAEKSADDNVAGDIARALNFGGPEDSAVSGMDEDILELTEVVTPGKKNLEEELTESFAQQAAQNPVDDFSSAGFGDQTMYPEQGGLESSNETLSPADILDDFPSPTLTEPGQSQITEDNQELSIPEDIFSDTAMRSSGMAETPEPPAMIENPIEQALEEMNKPEMADTPAFDGDDMPFSAEVPEFGQADAADSSEFQEQSDSLQNELEEALSWGGADEQTESAVTEEPFGEEVDVVGADLSNDLLDVSDNTEEQSLDDSLLNDQSVTFGELSPEESIESALEKAIGDDQDENLEEGWLRDDEVPQDEQPEAQSEQLPEQLTEQLEEINLDLSEPEAIQEVAEQAENLDSLEQAVLNSENEETPDIPEPVIDQEENSNIEISEPEIEQPEAVQADVEQNIAEEEVGTEESVEDMELAKASNISEQEEELGSAVASVKETVEQEIQSELTQQIAGVAAPEVSEVVPVQQANAAPSVVSPLEESIKDMLKPMLREWLDSNMPRLLEDAMKEQAKEDNKK